MFVGPYENIESGHKKALHRQSRIIKYYGMTTIILNNFLNACQKLFMSGRRHNRSHSKLIHLMKSFELYFERQLDHLSQSSKYKHHLCSHRYNCIIYPIFVSLEFHYSLLNIKNKTFIIKGISATFYCRFLVTISN
jgi:hypothetical protein